MKKIPLRRALRCAVAVTGVALASQALAQVTFYEREGFQGRSFRTDRPVRDFQRFGFNDRASSLVVESDRWEVCEDPRFDGRCVVLRRGRYPSLASMGLNNSVSSVREFDRNARIEERRAAPPPVDSRVTLYAREGFRGRDVTTDETTERLRGLGRYGRAASVVVTGRPWQVCEDAEFGGRCEVLPPGRYPSPQSMGLSEPVQSVREVEMPRHRQRARGDDGQAPVALADYRRRGDERIYEARVTSVRAVVGPPQQRCWVEREQVAQGGGGANVPGAVVGALIGGILGHQVGGGRGQDVATAGGAVAGAAIGANVNRGADGTPTTRDVQRCTSAPADSRPDYWDVTYDFRGREHRVQMTAPPGPTVTVNADGEPRT